jgi:ubiquinone/menaquinone biosynthesis C-methylase UbiE
VGRWSQLVARELLSWLALPADLRWLDVGCGTGALSASILTYATPREVLGIDASDGYVAYAHQQVQDPRVRFEVGDARALPHKTGAFDAVASGLVLNFVSEPLQMVAEMARVCRLGGAVAAYVWDYAGRMELMRHFWDAAVALDPAAVELDDGRRSPLCQPGPLAELWRGAGLADVP